MLLSAYGWRSCSPLLPWRTRHRQICGRRQSLERVRDRTTLNPQIIPRVGYFEVFFASEIGEATWADSEPPATPENLLLTSPDALSQAMQTLRVGSTLRLRVFRDGKSLTVTYVLPARPLLPGDLMDWEERISRIRRSVQRSAP